MGECYKSALREREGGEYSKRSMRASEIRRSLLFVSIAMGSNYVILHCSHCFKMGRIFPEDGGRVAMATIFKEDSS